MADTQEQARAASVCLTCKLGKRQCDKRLPICSRCNKLGRPCEYPPSPPVVTAAQPTESGPSMTRLSPMACIRCRANKRRCDRAIPECSRCRRVVASCVYPPFRLQSPAFADTDDSGPDMDSASLLVPAAMEAAMDTPIGYRSYMSPLLEFFLTSIALPSDTIGTNSLSHHLRSEWMKHAMMDPCLFHATLFSASASIDILRCQQNTAVTLYHQTWAIRLLNERLAQPEPVLTYGTLGAVIPLLYYNMVALDHDSAVAHQRGLVKMLLATPKSFRNNIGPLIAIVKIAMLSFACIYDMQPIWDCLYSESVRSSSLLRNLVSRAALGNGGSLFQKQTMDGILDVYEAVSRLDQFFHADRSSTSSIECEWAHILARSSPTTPWTDRHNYLTSSEKLNACCHLSCSIFWTTLRRRQLHDEQAPGSTDQDQLNQVLLNHILQVEPLYWIQNAPEAFTWVAFTGAAASTQPGLRANFINHAATVITAIDGEDLTLIRQGWRYFGLIKRLGGA